ncbi:MAG: hypothetical protein IT348_20305 [Candidatus Eisenbacteria bacterium]|nr:hypothetical protein [Candidatus Eisenbacteria bacterium]
MLLIAASPAAVRAGAPDGYWSFTPIVTRVGASAFADSASDRMLVFGGSDATAPTNQTIQMSFAHPELGWKPLLHGAAVPPPRSSASSAWDPAHRRLIVFGGGGPNGRLNDVWVLSLENTPEWRRLTPLGAPPSARAGAACAYDPKHDRLLVFGGSDSYGRPLGDLWSLSLSGTPSWDSLVVGGTPPTPRSSAAAIFDVKRDRFLVVGGNDGVSGGTMAAFALSNGESPSWSQLVAGGAPSARNSQAVIYDPQRDQLVLFGGLVNSGFTVSSLRGDLLLLSLAGTPSWTTWVPGGTAPSPRYGVAAAYDASRSRYYFFGGSSLVDGPPIALRLKGETYGLPRTGATNWSVHSLLPTFSCGSGPGQLVVVDAARDRVLRLGGIYYGVAPLPSGISERTISLSNPSAGWQSYFRQAVSYHPGHMALSGVIDAPRHRLILFAGRNIGNSALQNATSELTLAEPDTERVLSPTGAPPSIREYHTAITDPVAQRMIVFGGQNGTTRYSDLWQLTLSGTMTWTALAPTGTPPAARSAHSAVYDPVRRRMIVFGGRNASGAFRDVFALDLAGAPAWSPIVTTGPQPAARHLHAAVFDEANDRMLVFGGGGVTGSPYDTTWALVFAPQPHWVPLATDGIRPVPGWFNALVYDPARQVVVSLGGNVADQISLPVFAFLGGTPSPLDVEAPATLEHGPEGLRLACANPVRGTAELRWGSLRRAMIDLTVLDVAGRIVRRLEHRVADAGPGSTRWDGRDDSGVLVGPGIYFARLLGADGARSVRLVVLR